MRMTQSHRHTIVAHALPLQPEVPPRHEDTHTPVPLTSALGCTPLPHACAWGQLGAQLLPHCQQDSARWGWPLLSCTRRHLVPQLLPHCQRGCGHRHQTVPLPRCHCQHGCGLMHQALPLRQPDPWLPFHSKLGCSLRHQALPGQRNSAPVPIAESASCSTMYSSVAIDLSHYFPAFHSSILAQISWRLLPAGQFTKDAGSGAP